MAKAAEKSMRCEVCRSANLTIVQRKHQCIPEDDIFECSDCGHWCYRLHCERAAKYGRMHPEWLGCAQQEVLLHS